MLWTTTFLAFLSLIPAENADEAKKIIDAAIKRQTPAGAPPAITSYHADYKVSLHEDEKGRPTPKRSGIIEQWWQIRNGKVRYHRIFRSEVGTEAPTHYITDGTRFWFQIEGERVQSMEDPNLRDDLRNLREEIRRTGELMQLFFVSNILDASAKLRMGRTGVDVDDPKSRDTTDRIDVDEVIIERTNKRAVTLRIGKQDRLVYEAELSPLEGRTDKELFAFGYHQELEDQQIGKVMIPTRVTYAKNGKTVMEANVPKRSLERMRFNAPIPRKHFRPR